MEIEAKEASLNTMVVTIQALMVSNKQMTLAVFRQLPLRYIDPFEDDILSLWGIVRYKISDEGSTWIVLEKGGRLYRCPYPHTEVIDYSNYKIARNTLEHNKLSRDTEYIEKLDEKLRYEIKEIEEAKRYNNGVIEFQCKIRTLPQLFIAV
jgi:hypothetical protein